MNRILLAAAWVGLICTGLTAAEAQNDSARVEVKCLIPKAVPSIAGQVLEIRLYKIHPMIADKSADLVEKVEIKDFGHTEGEDTVKEIVVGAKARRDPQMKYYLTCFVLDEKGKRTHMGEPGNGQFLQHVLTLGNPKAATFKMRKISH